MTTSRNALRTLRAIYRHRDDASRETDASYIIYATLLALLVVGFPVTRALIMLLSPPEVLTLLQSPSAATVVSLVFGVIVTLLVAVGSVRGPVLLPPFFVTLLAETATPRSRTLTRTFATAVVYVLGGLLFLGIVVSAVRVFGGGLTLVSGIEFVLACLLFAVVASLMWLVGQVLAHRAWVLVVSLVVAIAASVLMGPTLAFTPWGWLGVVWGGDPTGSALAIVALTLLAIGSVLLLPVILNSLSREALLHQGQQFQAASVAAVTGDMATALGRFRTLPRIGRRWRAIGRSSGWVRLAWIRFFRSDAVGALRTPVRLMGGVVTLSSAFALLSTSLAPGPAPAWLLGAAAAGACYLGCGVLADGFRLSAVSAGAPPLYPYSTTHQYAVHLTFPLMTTVLAALVGFVIGVAFGAPSGALIVCLLIAVLGVLARAFDSAKGPPPLILMASPVRTEAGDPTILLLFVWQADALLIVAASGGVIASLAVGGSLLSGAALAAVVATGLILLLQRRLRAS